MELDLKDTIIKTKKVLKVNFTGQMVTHIQEILEITKDREKAS